MYPEDNHDDIHIKVMANNGDGTETEMTVEEFKENCLVEVNVFEIYVKL